MYRVLIVDDEMYAVKGIADGVDWRSLDVIEVHEAYNAQEAQGILIEERIDLMICDIQMPVMNGLSLLEWANAQQPGLKTIFLTCHAEFSYAQKAMQLGTRDYLLKPVVYEELAAVIATNLAELSERRLALTQTETFRKYYELWNEQRPALIQSFWRDMVSGTGDGRRQRLEQAIRQYDLPLAEHDAVLLVLLSIEEWKKPLNAFDEELLNYALRKAAEEVVVGDRPGHVLEDELGNMMIIGYLDEEEANRPKTTQAAWASRCEAYIEACRRFFYCDVSCYIGDVSAVEDIGLRYHELLEMEYGNVTRLRQVLVHEKRMPHEREAEEVSFLQWTDSLESGHAERIALWLAETEDWIRERQGSRETLVKVYHGVLQVVYYVLHRKGISPDALHDRGLTASPAEATRSSAFLMRWMEKIVQAVARLASEDGELVGDSHNSMVAKIKSYVAEHLHEDITRDELSAYVHLNPSYLSRLFRIRTGLSLSEYILQERMKRASELLAGTKGSISSIAKSLGYDNFSYFAKMFKKIHRMTPQEFRKSL